MSSNLNRSLDDIIKSRSKNKRGGQNRGGRKGHARIVQTTKENTYTKPAAPRAPIPAPDSGKVFISNLHPNVTEKDLRELFSQIGPLRSASINFNARGVSQGSGAIVFARTGDSIIAVRKYHGVTLDGMFVMVSALFRI